jgi:hypothetical protein
MRALGWLATTPAVWLYGVLAAVLGRSNLAIAVLAGAMRSADFPILGGTPGVLELGALCLLAVWIEIAAIRVLATPHESPTSPILFATTHLLKVLGFYIAMGITTMLIATAVVFSLTWLFSTVAGAVVSFLTVGLSSVLALALMSLSLLLPVWTLTPLGLRASVLAEGGVWESVLASISLFEESFGLTAAGLFISLVLDLSLFGAGMALNARDLSAPALLGIVAEWPGSNTVTGVLLLGLSALGAMFKLTLWTSIYLDASRRAAAAGEISIGASGSQVSARRWLTATAALARRAVHALRIAPSLLLFAALIAFTGMPGPADLLTIYRLIPTQDRSPNLDVFYAVVPNGGLVLLVLFPFGLVATTLFSAALIAATSTALRTGRADLGNAIGLAVERWWQLILAKGLVLFYMAVMAGLAMVGGLFALAIIVQMAPGLDRLGDIWTSLTAALGVSAAMLCMPFAARAVMLDNVSFRGASERTLDVIFERPLLVLIVFALSFGLDVAKGPLASLAGLLTNGWSLLLAVIFGRSLAQPIGWGTLGASVALLAVAALSVALKALMWTGLYLHAAEGADHQPDPEEQVAPGEAPPPAAMNSSLPASPARKPRSRSRS